MVAQQSLLLSSEENVAWTNGTYVSKTRRAVPNLNWGLNIVLLAPGGWPEDRKSHNDNDDAVAVPSNGVDVDDFHAMDTILDSSYVSAETVPYVELTWSNPNLPTRGLGLCPDASHTNIPDPRVAAR